MHTSRDDYLINTLRFVSTKEATQIYGAILPESLTSPEMKETKAYKTYLISPEEPTGKSKRVKRPAKMSTKAPARGVVIRETPKMPLSKKKEKMTLEKLKGIDLLSEVALTEEAQYEEARQKSLRDFHKTHSSGSGTVTKTAPSASKINPSITNERTGGNDKDDSNDDHDSSGEDSDQENDSDDDKTHSNNENDSDSKHETDENESGSESDQESNEEDIEDDKEEVKDEFVKTPSNDSDDEDETKITDKAKATNLKSVLLDFASVFQFNNRVTKLEKDVSELKKDDPLKTQVTALVDDHLDARLGATRDEFMNYLSALITAILAKESSQPQSSYKAAATLTKFELKKILIDKMDKSESYLAAHEHRECYEGLIKSYDLDKNLFSTYDKVYSLKRSQKDKDKDEDPSAGSDRRLKKRKTSKDAEPTKGPKAKESQSGSSKGTKSQPKSSRKSVQSEEPEFEVADSDMPQDQGPQDFPSDNATDADITKCNYVCLSS
ncbi:hypothetical protein Tco_1448986 [Tanacetum coccineum]